MTKKAKKEIPFSAGDQVRLTDKVLHKEYSGQVGTVKKIIKSRRLVCVALERGGMYEAHPENVEHIVIVAAKVFCNPDVCPSCHYVGDGDSLCDELREIVLADWEPTEHFMGPGCPYRKERGNNGKV